MRNDGTQCAGESLGLFGRCDKKLEFYISITGIVAGAVASIVTHGWEFPLELAQWELALV